MDGKMTEKGNAGEGGKGGGLLKPIILIAIILALFILVRVFGIGDRLGEIKGFIERFGAWGPLVFVGIYVVATVLVIPGSPLSIIAGAIFGSFVGVVVVIFGATIGASFAFLISRYFARESVAGWISRKESFANLDRMTEEHGSVIVALTRLVPIFPFNLLNYAFGLTRVRFFTYVFWSFFCMLPGTIMYVVGADLVFTAIAEGRVPLSLIGILAVAIVFVTVVVRYARKSLHEKERNVEMGSVGEISTKAVPELSPNDVHNKTLLSNTHPIDWVNPVPEPVYNLVVIGGGTAGLVCAAGAGGLGAKVALIEGGLLGGDCLNSGCVPSKAIIRSSRSAADITDANRFGVNLSGKVNVDFSAVMERMRRLRADISAHDSARRFSEEFGVHVFLGEGKFTGPRTVSVNGATLSFKRAVIATGTRPAEPPIKGLKEAGYLTNETIFSLTRRPGHLVIIGGGPIGCELAQTFRRLGSKVTVVEMADQFLIREDKDAADILKEAFESEGIKILLGTAVKEVAKKGKKKIVTVVKDGIEKNISADEILVGVGRIPNVEGLNLEAAGVKYNRFGVIVDDRLRTSNRRIYGAGDVAIPYKFTHTADASARIVIQNALFFGRKRLSALTVPWTTYTDPEIAHVGMYERDAEGKGIKVTTFKQELRDVDRAVLDGEMGGFVKVHVREGTDRILGATIVARHAGEMISEITAAMRAGLGLGSLSSVIHPYPTQAEAIRQLGDKYNRTKLTPMVKKIFKAWLSLNR